MSVAQAHEFEMVKDKEAWHTATHGVAENQTRLSKFEQQLAITPKKEPPGTFFPPQGCDPNFIEESMLMAY